MEISRLKNDFNLSKFKQQMSRTNFILKVFIQIKPFIIFFEILF